MPSPTLVVLKIYPADIESIPLVEEAVKKLKNGEVKEVRRDPIAFGMELIKVAIILPPAEDAMEKLENEIKSIKGVNEMEVEAMTLL